MSTTVDGNGLAVHTDPIPASGDTTIILPFEEFSVDLEHNLGRANGNCYQRKPGVPGAHDGQIMVRLKKKRFIVLDYSIVPTAADIACAAVTPHIKCPPGAGQAQCNAANCTKIGVPVCLFDSNPDEPTSLYLRSGLCFTCQRLLNEKRRTQRKRKSDVQGKNASGSETFAQKRIRINGEIVDVHADAIILNGPFDGTKHHGPGYEYPEIMTDLQKIGADVSGETAQLANAIISLTTPPLHNSQDHAQVEALYNKTFHTISKGIFLLSEMKSSFDAAVNNASIAEKATEEVLESASIADVVASAAAVAAAQSAEVAAAAAVTNGDDEQASSTMIPSILLPPDGKEGAESADVHDDKNGDDEGPKVEV